jgi:hypothetical protein
MDLGDTEGTVALRVPDHELARELLRRTGPLAVSSANITSLPAALTCDEAIDQLGDNVAVYLDGGALGNGAAASTIVDFSQDERGEVLRHGALSLEVLRETLPEVRDLVEGDPATEAAVTPSTVESDAVDAPVADDEVEPAQLADQELVEAPLSDQEAVSAGDAVPTERPPER